METMTIERLSHLLDAYGADAARWPAEERAPAAALIANSAPAKALVDAARELDRVLARRVPPRPSPALAARLSGMIGGTAAARPTAARRNLRPLAALALAASVLLAIGVAVWPGSDEADPAAGWMMAAPGGENIFDIGLTEDAPLTNDRRVALALY